MLKTRNLAERVFAHEAKAGRADFSPFQKLRPQLATLMGNSGFRALAARACALAGVEIDWLLKVKVGADGSIEGLSELEATLGPDAIHEGQVLLLAYLLELLVTFIGEILTLRLVRETWPTLPGAFDFSRGDKNEKQAGR